jgi:hypothetical protein
VITDGNILAAEFVQAVAAPWNDYVDVVQPQHLFDQPSVVVMNCTHACGSRKFAAPPG